MQILNTGFLFSYIPVCIPSKTCFINLDCYIVGMPLGQMPILEFNGIRAFQSVAITRYVAKTVGLGGANLLEDLKIDTIVDTIGDLRASEFKCNRPCQEVYN